MQHEVSTAITRKLCRRRFSKRTCEETGTRTVAAWMTPFSMRLLTPANLRVNSVQSID